MHAACIQLDKTEKKKCRKSSIVIVTSFLFIPVYVCDNEVKTRTLKLGIQAHNYFNTKLFTFGYFFI